MSGSSQQGTSQEESCCGILGYQCHRVLEYSPYNVLIMKHCYKKRFDVAWSAHPLGAHKVKINGIGLPLLKFSLLQYDEDKDKDEKDGGFKWVPQVMYPSMEHCLLREELISVIKDYIPAGCEIIKGSTMLESEHSIFWSFQDMEYFINKVSKLLKRLSSTVFFLLCQPTGTSHQQHEGFAASFPLFEYLFDNAISEEAMSILRFMPTSSSTEENPNERVKQPACNSSKCGCVSYYKKKYPGDELNIVYCNKQGELVPLENHDIISTVECTNHCGCDENCKSRNLQRGQKVPMVAVVTLGNDGMEIRAGDSIKKGQFIMEVVGDVKLDPKRDVSSLEHGVESFCIDFGRAGNLTKYVKTSSVPNAALVFVLAREVAIARWGLFAKKAIDKGEIITCRFPDQDAEK